MFRLRKWQWLDLLLIAGIALLFGRMGGWRREPVPPAAGVQTGVGGNAVESLPFNRAANAVRAPVLRAQPVLLDRHERAGVTSDSAASVGTLLREDRWERLPTLAAMELVDTGESFELTLSMSGLQPESLHLRLDGAILSVLAPRTSGNGGLGLVRRVMLPLPVNDDLSPVCFLTNDVLRIRIAKRLPSAAQP